MSIKGPRSTGYERVHRAALIKITAGQGGRLVLPVPFVTPPLYLSAASRSFLASSWISVSAERISAQPYQKA